VSTTQRLALVLLARHPDEAARLLDARPSEEVAGLLEELEDPVGAGLLTRLAPALAAAALGHLAPARAAPLLAALPPHRMARLLRRTPVDRRTALLAGLAPALAVGVRRLLAYEHGTAGSLMDPQVFAIPEDVQVGVALATLAEGRGAGHYAYGIDREGRLAGVVALRDLLALDPKVALGTVMQRTVVRLRTRDDTRAVVVHPAWTDFHALPVVDDDGVLVGVLRYRTVRRLELEAGGREAPVPLAAALAELYWLGLVGVTEGIATVVERAAERARGQGGG
jgi:magnesium transporter